MAMSLLPQVFLLLQVTLMFPVFLAVALLCKATFVAHVLFLPNLNVGADFHLMVPFWLAGIVSLSELFQI